MENITNLPLTHLHESPTNPRKTFSAAGLQELADSLRSQGVMSPIVVRPHPTHLQPLHYEIVFGHRRFRAAQLAELAGIPAIIRNLSNEQAGLAQLHENLEREDVSPIEEAEAYKRLMTVHGVTAEALILQTGKSKSYIYGRLKLNALTPGVREACAQGLPTDVALKIARLPGEAIQLKALKLVSTKIDDKPGFVSMRDGIRIIDQQTFVTRLADKAIFDHATECASCPHRSDNDPDLLLALGAGACTDRPCFDSRTVAQYRRQVNEHAAKGLTVLLGAKAEAAVSQARWPLSYASDVSHFRIDRPASITATAITPNDTIAALLRLMGADHAPAITLAQTQPEQEPVELIESKHLPAIRAFFGVEDASAKTGSTPTPAARANLGGAADADDDEDNEEDSGDDHAHAGALPLPLTPEEEAVRRNWVEVLRASIRAAQTAPRTTEELRMIVGALIDLQDEIPDAIVAAFDWDDDLEELGAYRADVNWLLARLPEMSANQLAGLAVGLAMMQVPVNANNQGQRWAAQVALAKAYGVNPLDPSAPPAAPTPTPAAQAHPGANRVIRKNPALVNGELPLEDAEDGMQSSQLTPACAVGASAEGCALNTAGA